MKFPQISAFASVFFVITTQLFAGSQLDPLQEISTNPIKRKGAPSQNFSSSKRTQLARKHVSFNLTDDKTETLEPSVEAKKIGLTQEAWDARLNFDEITGDYHQLVLRKTVITLLTQEDLRTQASSRMTFILTELLPDCEWEYAFSVLEYALGLTPTFESRNRYWNHPSRSHEEVWMVLSAIGFHLKLLKPDESLAFMANLKKMKDSQKRELQESKHYDFQATHTLFEEAYDPEKIKEFNYLALTPNERKSKALVKKIELLKGENRQFENAAKNAKLVIKEILKTRLFGTKSNQVDFLKNLSEFYTKGVSPQPLFAPTSDEKVLYFKRFVISLKQYLFRFITPEEEEFMTFYEENLRIARSKQLEF